MKIPSHGGKKRNFSGFLLQNLVLFLFCSGGAGSLWAPADPGVPFSPFRLAVRDCGTFRRYCGQTESRQGQKQHAPPPRPHQKWDEPRSAGAKRFSSLILGFRHQVCALLEKEKRFKTFRPSVRVCVGAVAPSRSRIMRSRNSITAAVKKPRPSHRAGLDAFTGSYAKAHGGWEDRLMRKKSFKAPPPLRPLLSIHHARSRHIRRSPRWKNKTSLK